MSKARFAGVRPTRPGDESEPEAEACQDHVAAVDRHGRAAPRAACNGADTVAAIDGIEQIEQGGLGTTEQLGLSQGTTLLRSGREMHEADMAALLLRRCPVEREIIEEVAEVASGGTRRRRRKSTLLQVFGKLPRGNRRVEPGTTPLEDAAALRQRAARVGPHLNAIVSELLDAKPAGPPVQAEMQNEPRLVTVEKIGSPPGDLDPFGGEHRAVKATAQPRRGDGIGESLDQPLRHILRGTRKRAEPGEQDRLARHDVSGLAFGGAGGK